eukprot:CAMPEP_0113478626 /NCGR_PEP_ID=MMETSP0014_2-20120614/20858_1 /TAXON_ID=2857 /ORGANISM="Nitzschia sp." /LENGTH=386 /DNA_ID=CAMNT_0000371833 /DNA_START=279 /DNA_END=1439 /DNA_ORIENTATION=- /assembly_acc=CAM_ASM_000159
MVSVSKRTPRRTYQFPSGAPGKEQILYALLSVGKTHNIPKSQIAIMSSFNRRGQDGYELFDIILNELVSGGIIDMNILDGSLLNVCVPKLKAFTTATSSSSSSGERQGSSSLSSSTLFRQYHVMTTNKHLHDMIRQPLWGTTLKMLDVLFDDYTSNNNIHNNNNNNNGGTSITSMGPGDDNEGKPEEHRRLPPLVLDVASRLGLNIVDEEFHSSLDCLVEYKYVIVASYEETESTESEPEPGPESGLVGSSSSSSVDDGRKPDDFTTNEKTTNTMTTMTTTTTTTKSMRIKLSEDLFPFTPTVEYDYDIVSTALSPSPSWWLDLEKRLPPKKRRLLLLEDDDDEDDDDEDLDDEEDQSLVLDKQQQRQQSSVVTPPHHDLTTICSS